jgi:hypothetical protein
MPKQLAPKRQLCRSEPWSKYGDGDCIAAAATVSVSVSVTGKVIKTVSAIIARVHESSE